MKKIIKSLKNIYYEWNKWGFKFAVYKTLSKFPEKGCFFGFIHKKFMLKRHNYIINFIESKCVDIFEKYNNIEYCNNDSSNISKEVPIWVCWFQGEENAPLIVKKCIDSIRKNSNGHPVNLITYDNYKNYVQLPKHIIEKFESGKIILPSFSDILRTCLLRDYGGIWLDATIYLTKALTEDIFDMDLFSIKDKLDKNNYKYISNCQWAIFAFASKKHSILCNMVMDIFDRYWKEEDNSIDYFVTDYIVACCIKNNKTIKNMFDNIPINNTHIYELKSILNMEYSEEDWRFLLSSGTYIFKLSWKDEFYEYTENNKPTFYKALIDNFELK